MTSMTPAQPATATLPSTSFPASAGNVALAERSVPRYTSYPTAPHFGPAVNGATYRDWLGRLADDTSLSLYLHVPFCQTMCSYCGCHTKVTRKVEPIEAYRRHLEAEIDLVSGLTAARRVRHIHWGGGTPSMLGPAGLESVARRLAARFDIGADAEHAIELDPRQVDDGLAATLVRMGVNRASLGVQDLNPHVQEAIGRIQPHEVVVAAVAALQRAGIGQLSFDLMYGLPHQSLEDLLRTIDQVAALKPGRLSLFGYAHVPWFKTHQRLIDEAALPDAAERFRQANAARDALIAHGYEAIGLDHFALPSDSMAIMAREQTLKRNFQGYTTDDAEALLAFGASAIGRLPQGFVQNAPDIGGYQRSIEAGEPATVRGLALSLDDRVRGDAIERLMCDFSADLEAVARRHGVPQDFFDADLARLQPLEHEGLVSRKARTVVVSDAGKPLVRVVASLFDAHLAKAGRHSAAV